MLDQFAPTAVLINARGEILHVQGRTGKYTELAIDDIPEWNPAKDCLAEIKSASLRAKDVVRNILSFTRKTPAERKPFQVSTIVKESFLTSPSSSARATVGGWTKNEPWSWELKATL